ncbi:MAG: hypothetical protein ACM3ML_08235 [Micromonosporaceae bacterium]
MPVPGAKGRPGAAELPPPDTSMAELARVPLLGLIGGCPAAML